MKSIQRGHCVPWFVVLSTGMALGCTTEDGGGKSGSDEASSSSSGIVDDEHDEDIEYPECVPGVAKMFSSIATQEGKVDLEYPASDPYVSWTTLQFTLGDDDFLFLTYPDRPRLEDRFDHLLPVTGGVKLPPWQTIGPALPGSTAFVASAPESPWQFAYIHFHIFSELQTELVGCMAPPVLP
jgi:hypothetical protein